MDTYISNAAIHTARAPEWREKKKHFFDDKIQEFEIYVQNQKTLHSFFFNSGYPTRPSPPLRIALVKSIRDRSSLINLNEV